MNKKQFNQFKWRVWNTFKTVVLPVIMLGMYTQLQGTPDKLDAILTARFWETILYASLMALLGSVLAGMDKVQREVIRK